MSDPTIPPLPQPEPPAKRRRWPWIVAILAALFVGVGIGAATPQAEGEPVAAATSPAKQSGAVAKPDPRIAEVEAEVDELTTQRDGLRTLVDEYTATIADLQAAAAAQPEPEPEPEPQGDTLTAGRYEFSDVQVSEDFAGDFELRARVTNTGGDIEGVLWTATLFNGGSVVGTLTGSAESFDSGETLTAEFFSLDAFGSWDSVEFQTDMEY